MVTKLLVELSVTLEPVGQPWIAIDVHDQHLTKQLTKTTKFDWNFVTEPGLCSIQIRHFDKQDNDPDTAVKIQKISFFGIEDPRFVWAGIYRPEYPAHWQDPIAELTNIDYMGWNGQWKLTFDVPVFTWIHQIQNLGWAYP